MAKFIFDYPKNEKEYQSLSGNTFLKKFTSYTNGFEESAKQINKILDDSPGQIIPLEKAKAMIGFFDAKNDTKHYTLNRKIVELLLDKVNKTQMYGYKTAMYLYIGKESVDVSGKEENPYHLLAEPVFYKDPYTGHTINHAMDITLKDDKYYWAFNIANTTIYEGEHQRDICHGFIKYKDQVDRLPVEQIFVDTETLSEFLHSVIELNDNAYNFLKLSFARNANKGWLTVIFSCHEDTSKEPLLGLLSKNGYTVVGYFEDEHGLIPPPPY